MLRRWKLNARKIFYAYVWFSPLGHVVKIKHTNISYLEKKLHEAFPIYGSCLCGLREMSKLRTVYLTLTALPLSPLSSCFYIYSFSLHPTAPESRQCLSLLLPPLPTGVGHTQHGGQCNHWQVSRQEGRHAALSFTTNSKSHLCTTLALCYLKLAWPDVFIAANFVPRPNFSCAPYEAASRKACGVIKNRVHWWSWSERIGMLLHQSDCSEK